MKEGSGKRAYPSMGALLGELGGGGGAALLGTLKNV
jgi:hypothetical protein